MFVLISMIVWFLVFGLSKLTGFLYADMILAIDAFILAIALAVSGLPAFFKRA